LRRSIVSKLWPAATIRAGMSRPIAPETVR
jgi:hypothetical protein